jgi:DNA recombination protein RmuC
MSIAAWHLGETRRMTDSLPLIIGVTMFLAFIAVAAVAFLVWQAHRPAPVHDEHLAELNRQNADAAARLEAMIGLLAKGQSQLQHTVNERLESVSHRLGDSLQKTTQTTTENLQKLNERLAVIDSAQKNITDLASQVTSLQGVLTNKQSRGAFGQVQLEAIVSDALPKGAYEFQHTLPNKTRPDCAIFMPDSGPLIIDAKFPLEAMTAVRDAVTDEERKQAIQRVKQDISKHIVDIAEKYLIPGATQDIALMFIPSESVYAELHERFDDMVQRAQRARVMIVSPTLMMLAIQVIRQFQKDSQLREAADQIKTEVGNMMKDVRLLGERTRKLQNHFGQATEDLSQILTSAGRIEKRAAKIEELEFDGEDAKGATIIAAPMTRRLEAGE